MSLFSDTIQQKRDQEAADFKELAQTARLVAAINKQTDVIKQQNQKLDTIIELLKKDVQADAKEDTEPKSAKET